jgi:hydrogenase maturation factor
MMKRILLTATLFVGLLVTFLPAQGAELAPMQNKTMAQRYIRKFTSAFKTLSPTTLRSIISKQSTAFNKNFNAFMAQKTTSNAMRVIANVAAITAAVSVLTGEAAAIAGATYFGVKKGREAISARILKPGNA